MADFLPLPLKTTKSRGDEDDDSFLESLNPPKSIFLQGLTSKKFEDSQSAVPTSLQHTSTFLQSLTSKKSYETPVKNPVPASETRLANETTTATIPNYETMEMTCLTTRIHLETQNNVLENCKSPNSSAKESLGKRVNPSCDVSTEIFIHSKSKSVDESPKAKRQKQDQDSSLGDNIHLRKEPSLLQELELSNKVNSENVATISPAEHEKQIEPECDESISLSSKKLDSSIEQNILLHKEPSLLHELEMSTELNSSRNAVTISPAKPEKQTELSSNQLDSLIGQNILLHKEPEPVLSIELNSEIVITISPSKHEKQTEPGLSGNKLDLASGNLLPATH